ncbi:MAG: helix-turn-helix domain-containing protein, partial [Actinomycetota bacterium]|nr:helix-turn-helix domain-containing protein [Actinomycetota bacterium]
RVVGLLWVITDDDREANARRVLSDAAPEVAVELQRHLTADTSRASDRRTAARQMLDGHPVRSIADLLGAPPVGGYLAVLVRPVGTAPGEIDAMARTAQLATVYVDAYRVPALVAPVGGAQVELVVALTATTTAERARGLLDELAARTRATFGIEVRCAMGTVAATARELPASRRDALAVLDLLVDGDGDGPATASYDEVRVAVGLQELLQQARFSDHLTRGPVVDLASEAGRNSTQLVDTVRSFLGAGGDVTRTASAIGVHRNTVRYRVQRFEELTGTDLSDPDQRLVTEIQLRATMPPG